MRRRAARDAVAGEEPSLTPTATAGLVEGTLIIIDLDELGETVEERGWSEYSPNPATGLLTAIVERLVWKHRAVVVYGLDEERGTEEVVLEIPYTGPREVEGDLVEAAVELCRETGVTATMVAVSSPVGAKPVRGRREAYSGFRLEARRLVEALKRRGGGVVYVDGRIVYTSPCRRRPLLGP